MNVSSKFDIDPLGGLSGNARKPKSVTDGWTNERTDGRTDEQTHSYWQGTKKQ